MSFFELNLLSDIETVIFLKLEKKLELLYIEAKVSTCYQTLLYLYSGYVTKATYFYKGEL